MKKSLLFSALLSVAVPSFATNSDGVDPIKSDPVLQGWMQGQPPAADKVIRKQDNSFYHFPQLLRQQLGNHLFRVPKACRLN